MRSACCRLLGQFLCRGPTKGGWLQSFCTTFRVRIIKKICDMLCDYRGMRPTMLTNLLGWSSPYTWRKRDERAGRNAFIVIMKSCEIYAVRVIMIFLSLKSMTLGRCPKLRLIFGKACTTYL